MVEAFTVDTHTEHSLSVRQLNSRARTRRIRRHAECNCGSILCETMPIAAGLLAAEQTRTKVRDALGTVRKLRPLPKGQTLQPDEKLVVADRQCTTVEQWVSDAVRDLLPRRRFRDAADQTPPDSGH